jgi:hypothetical protein
MFLCDTLVEKVFELSFIIIICYKVNNVCEVFSTHSVLLVKCPRVNAGTSRDSTQFFDLNSEYSNQHILLLLSLEAMSHL